MQRYIVSSIGIRILQEFLIDNRNKINTKMYSDKNSFASLSNRQNPGNADEMGISGVDLCLMAQK